MPYAEHHRVVKAREVAKRHYDENKETTAREKLYKKLARHFQKTEQERASGATVRGLAPAPKASTLEKYGIQVFLADPSMFDDTGETNKNTFIQIRSPVLVENWSPQRPTPSASTDVASSLSALREKMSAMTLKDFDVKSKNTVDKCYKTFARNVEKLGCDDLLVCINSGELLKFILNEYPVRNTLKSHLYSYWFLVVQHDLIPGVEDDAKKAIGKEFKRSADKVKVHQVLSTMDERNKVEPYDEILRNAQKDFDALSDEVVLLTVYNELTLRDDFPEVVVFTNSGEGVYYRERNYYDSSTGIIYFNHRNKVNKNEQFEYKFSGETKKLLNRYIAKHKKEWGDKLFTTPPRKILNNIGLSFNKLRHAKVVELYGGENLTYAQLEDYADRMNHSVYTQQIYARGRSGKFVIAPA